MKDCDPSMPDDFLSRLAAALTIAHHIPGRVRLKLDGAAERGLAALADDAKALHRALTGAEGIRSVALNPLARSCTIEYDPTVIPPSAWPDLLRGEASAAAGTLLRIATAGFAGGAPERRP